MLKDMSTNFNTSMKGENHVYCITFFCAAEPFNHLCLDTHGSDVGLESFFEDLDSDTDINDSDLDSDTWGLGSKLPESSSSLTVFSIVLYIPTSKRINFGSQFNK